MSKIKWCKRCPSEIDHYTTRQSKAITRKKINNHEHYGNAVYKYGVCFSQHYTKISMIRVEWRPCSVCLQQKKTIEKRRKYLRQKARIEKKQIPKKTDDVNITSVSKALNSIP